MNVYINFNLVFHILAGIAEMITMRWVDGCLSNLLFARVWKRETLGWTINKP